MHAASTSGLFAYDNQLRDIKHNDGDKAEGRESTNLLAGTVGQATLEASKGTADLVLHGWGALLVTASMVVMMMMVNLNLAVASQATSALGGGCSRRGGSSSAAVAKEPTAAGASSASRSCSDGSALAMTAGSSERHVGWYEVQNGVYMNKVDLLYSTVWENILCGRENRDILLRSC